MIRLPLRAASLRSPCGADRSAQSGPCSPWPKPDHSTVSGLLAIISRAYPRFLSLLHHGIYSPIDHVTQGEEKKVGSLHSAVSGLSAVISRAHPEASIFLSCNTKHTACSYSLSPRHRTFHTHAQAHHTCHGGC